ncbi:secretin [Pasteurellaceae bacterium Macca]|nr:secretin [Pasteurellaceae bacterium Macca]
MRILLLCFALLVPRLNAETISLSLKDAPSAEVLAYLAEETGKNLILNDEMKTIKALRLENRTFAEVLNTIAQSHQLMVKQEHGVYSLTPKATPSSLPPLPSQEKQVVALPAKLKLQTKSIKLHYTKASEMIDSLTKGSGSLLSEQGYLHYDERSNSLIIKDNPNAIRHFTALVRAMDKPVEQIAIEARIVTISSENLKELGVRWGLFTPNEQTHRFAGNIGENGANLNNLNVNFPLPNAPSVVLQIAKVNSRVLDLELNALERENSVEIIASPRLLTTNKQKASIKQGTEIPYVIYDRKSESNNVEFKEAVLGLEVTPHIAKNNQILLDLLVTQNAPNDQHGVNALTTIDKQELATQVFAKHGETIILGGIFQHIISKGEDRVPILGSIPFIKKLFSQSRDRISKRELVIFVTPHIIRKE